MWSRGHTYSKDNVKLALFVIRYHIYGIQGFFNADSYISLLNPDSFLLKNKRLNYLSRGSLARRCPLLVRAFGPSGHCGSHSHPSRQPYLTLRQVADVNRN